MTLGSRAAVLCWRCGTEGFCDFLSIWRSRHAGLVRPANVLVTKTTQIGPSLPEAGLPTADFCRSTFDTAFKKYDYSPMASEGRFVVFRVMRNWQEVASTLDRLGPSITTYQVVAAFKCLSVMKNLPPEASQLLTRLSDIARNLSNRMLPEHLATIICCCGKMQYWNSKMLNGFAKTILRCRLHGRMGPANYTKLIGALGMLHSVLVKEFSRELRSGETVLLFKSFDLFMDRVGRQMSKPHNMEQFDRHQLVKVLVGLSKMRHSEPVGEWEWVIPVIEETLSVQHVPEYSEKELVMILCALRKLGIPCQETPVWFVRELMHEDRMEDYTGEELATMMWNLGVMEFCDVVNVAYALMDQITLPHRLTAFTNRDLLSVLEGCAMQGYREEYPFRSLVVELIRHERVSEFTPAELIRILDSFQRLQFKEIDMLSHLWVQLFNENRFRRRDVLKQREQLRPDLTRGYTCAIMYRFGKLGLAEWEVRRREEPEPERKFTSGFESPPPQIQLTGASVDQHTGIEIPPLYRGRTAFRMSIGWQPLKEGRRVPVGRNTLKKKRRRQEKARHQKEAREFKKRQREERVQKKEFHERRRASMKARRESMKRRNRDSDYQQQENHWSDSEIDEDSLDFD
ncbi:hypothetical protein BSKO_03310 [Bryopsis sp. KO-2023]|nr:hypothetical protein BSKO_03310 [Bryopsis sp. KO-2023]